MLPQLSICTLIQNQTLRETVQQTLNRARCTVVHCSSAQEFLDQAQAQKHQIDCAILEEQAGLTDLSQQLQDAGVLLPLVIMSEIGDDRNPDKNIGPPTPSNPPLYHAAEVWFVVKPSDDTIAEGIQTAIEQFLDLSNDPNFPQRKRLNPEVAGHAKEFLMKKQRRLTDKLRERLGYLGVYYKRNPELFLRNLPQDEQQALLQDLQKLYREIVLDYFSNDVNINPILDELVNIAFFSDISVAHIVEIHMELMDEFSKQLKLEGRSEEILLDYRLTLIDTIAHLCEMYRRSIPREL